MVDFKKRLGVSKIEKKIDPREIYQGLDRASDKGPLRPAQEAILEDWFNNYREKRDVIIKLHTGQGKTLIGLLILQSKLNQDKGPALYLCHNNYLISQTCKQADSFGISYITMEDEIPDSFIDGNKILITSVQKLFNGLTKFKIGPKFQKVSTLLMDDSHACIDVIKDSCKIRIESGTNPYNEILTLFGPELEKQGVGSYADILRNDFESFLAVPYWDWQDKQSEIANILSKYSDLKEIKFAWPLLKDILRDCQCIISGTCLEITSYMTPLQLFGSYYSAEQRIFMSATLTDDAFFIKGLGLDANTVLSPLCYKDEKWSGEKMILIPSLIDESLDRSEVVAFFASPKDDRKFGVVALTPSFNHSKNWEAYGATLAKKSNIDDEIEKLVNKDCENTLVITNRYDGIDLPDHACRVLIMDSKPYSESLFDRYYESCRARVM